MGSVKHEQVNDGKGRREFDYITFSEPRVVKALIERRSQLDPAFLPSLEPTGIVETSGVYVTGDPVVNTYLDLDILIARCSLTKSESYVAKRLMVGYTCQDIADFRGVSVKTVRTIFGRLIGKIVAENNRHWRDVYRRKFGLI